jgi:hypothetical protein
MKLYHDINVEDSKVNHPDGGDQPCLPIQVKSLWTRIFVFTRSDVVDEFVGRLILCEPWLIRGALTVTFVSAAG